MKDIVIMSYDERTDDGGVGRETLVGQRKGGTGQLDSEIIEMKSEVQEKLKYEMIK